MLLCMWYVSQQPPLSHTLWKNLKFKLLYFWAENMWVDILLNCCLPDEDKNWKICLLYGFSLLWRHMRIWFQIFTLKNINAKMTVHCLRHNRVTWYIQVLHSYRFLLPPTCPWLIIVMLGPGGLDLWSALSREAPPEN